MQKDPDHRYQSAREFLSDIEAFQKNPSIQFEYKYMANEALEQARYRDAIHKVREEDVHMTKNNKSRKPEKLRNTEERRKKMTPKNSAAGRS
jgi:serine/threonine-protein kinase